MWAGMLAGPTFFLVLVLSLSVRVATPGVDAGLALGVFTLASLALFALSFVVPRFVRPDPSVVGTEVAARARFIAALALREAGALMAIIGYFLTRQPLLLVPAAIALVGLAAAFPTARRWQSLCEGVTGPRNPLVRS